MSFLYRLIGSVTPQEVDTAPQAARGILYDFAGNLITPANRAAVSETAGGVLHAGKDYKIARTLRASQNGALVIAGDETMLLNDSGEGTTRNLNTWIETLTTMASTQTLATGLLLNSASTLTTTTGILESSHRSFPVLAKSGLHFRARLRFSGATNCFEEWGFSDCASATTALINNGAFFRRDGAGSLQPILAFNGTEGAGPTMTGPGNTEYAWYDIFLEDDRATFQITSVTGVLLSSVVMERGATGGSGTGVATAARLLAVTHIPAFFRVYNSGAAGSAPQIAMTMCTVQMVDSWSQRSIPIQQSGMLLNAASSPTAFTQLANWTNSAAPTTRTLSNTAAAETTLGGLLVVNAIAGGATDLIMFGWQNPAPYTFYCDGVWIPAPLNQVVAVATTATIFQYFMAFNSSAVSLATAAPYSPMRVALPGVHTAAVALAANALFSGNQIFVQFATPFAVHPGRFLHIGCREIVGTATATETYLWAGVGVSGFFE